MNGPEPAGRHRLRIRFSKVGKIRWTSHRDLARMWERAFRRERLPLSYSEGFSPRPRVSFGLALPTGHESVAEYLDVELRTLEGLDLTELPGRLSAALPVGVDATAVAELTAGTPSLQEDVRSCSWVWMVADGDDGGDTSPLDAVRLGGLVDRLIASPSAEVTRNRKGRDVTEDVRPGILDLRVANRPAGDGGPWLEAELAAQPRAVRPADVMAAIGGGLIEWHVRRTHQWIERDGARAEPLAVDPLYATDARRALERV